LIKKGLYLKRYTVKRLTDEFPVKSWTKHGVNKLLKKLKDTGTVDRPMETQLRRSHLKLVDRNLLRSQYSLFMPNSKFHSFIYVADISKKKRKFGTKNDLFICLFIYSVNDRRTTWPITPSIKADTS